MGKAEKRRKYFSDKVVIITGSSRGIGKATACLLCGYGAKVVINGRDKEALGKTLDEFKEAGYDIEAIQGDVATREGSRHLIDKTLERYGRIDILVNNAGLSMRGPVDELDPLVFETMFSVNVMGAVYPMIYALPSIKERSGSIVFVSTVAAIRGLPGLSAYSSSKMALRGLAETMRFDLRKYGVHTGLIYVGYAENDKGKVYMNCKGSYSEIKDRKKVKTLSQTKVAEHIIDNLYHRKFIHILSGLGRLNNLVQRISPALVEKILFRAMKKVNSMSN